MSPVNSDDHAGDAFGAAGRRLTRKESRSQRQLQGSTGHDAPEQPASPPTVHRDPADTGQIPAEQLPADQAHAGQAQDWPAPDNDVPSDELAHDEPAPDDGMYGEPAHGEPGAFPAGHVLDYAAAAPAVDPAGDAHYVYADQDVPPEDDQYEEDGRAVPAGGSAIAASKRTPKKVRRRRRLIAVLLALSVFTLVLVVGAQFLKPLLGGNTLTDYPGPGTGEVSITVPAGAGPKSVATELQEKDVIANADTFLKEFLASGGALAPGDFTMRKEMNNSDAVAVLLNRGQDKVMYFALSAGLRIGESLQAISEGTGVPVVELRELSDSPEQFGVSARAQNLEGYLAPGEHRFPLGTPAKEVLQNLVTTTLDELTAQGITDPDKQYDVITVASIVQAEGGQAEYGDVAGAIYNRLKPDNIETNGLIQSDATVTYGLGIKSFHIDEEQKADKSNPYNTYANQGLPVGPIGSPGKTAIDAAAKPKANEYLYWVTINLDTKETLFSKTLAEHNTYVERYNSWCGANPGRCV